MPHEDHHLSDQELLMAADGELNARPAAHAQAHLVSCWKCRARMREMEETIAAFVQARSQELDPQMPPVAGPRALLKAQLSVLAAQTPARRWERLVRLDLAIYASAALALVTAVLFAMQYRAAAERLAEPKRSLTPGVVRTAAVDEVCLAQPSAEVRNIPASLQRRVFEEYGMQDASADLYEVDYLITPELGGAADLRNLWPEPYSKTVWNAHVKDALEDRLRGMVCEGKLDLATAQREIATDWISAYKKYFHTNKPLTFN